MPDDFRVLMQNKWYLTSYETFNQPKGDLLMEGLRVTLSKSLLVIEGLKGNTLEVEAVISARKALDLATPSVTAFVIVEDNITSSAKAFPAVGTALIYKENNKWRLRAAGYDKNGSPKGWIFDATETGPA